MQSFQAYHLKEGVPTRLPIWTSILDVKVGPFPESLTVTLLFKERLTRRDYVFRSTAGTIGDEYSYVCKLDDPEPDALPRYVFYKLGP